MPRNDVDGSSRSIGARMVSAAVSVAAVVSAAVILVGGIAKTSRSLDVLTSTAIRQSSRQESTGYRCLEAKLRHAIPRGATVFDAAASVLLYQRVAELLTPGYTFARDAAHARYVVDVKPGTTTCKFYAVSITAGGDR